MTMTPEEIVRDYKQAAKPMNQIKILAELNGCSNSEIAKILIEAGESVPGIFMNRGKKKGIQPEEPEPEKESFELKTENPPLVRTEITVGALIAALESVPADAIIMEGYNAVKVIMDQNLSTGMRKTLVSIGRVE